LTCHDDAELYNDSSVLKYCHKKSLSISNNNSVFSSIQLNFFCIGVLVNFCIMVGLIVYIIRLRRYLIGGGGLKTSNSDGFNYVTAWKSTTPADNSVTPAAQPVVPFNVVEHI
jgi:hypothetical protein